MQARQPASFGVSRVAVHRERERLPVAMARLALAAMSPAGHRGRLTILIHHRVRRERDPLFPDDVDAVRFDRLLHLLSRLFNVLPLSEALRMLAAGTLPARAACITFDDGYADNCEVALPILQRHRLTATFFISTGYLDGGRMWNDTIIESVRAARGERLDLAGVGLRPFPIATDEHRRAAIAEIIAATKYLDPPEREDRCQAIRELANADLPDDLMLRSDQVRALRDAGMEIGAHTVTHPILSRIPKDIARREIADGKAALEALLGARVRHFAYPNGVPGTDYAREHIEIVRSLAFEAALSTAWGAASSGSDVFQLPRFTPWDRTPGRIALRFVRNLRTRIEAI